MISNLSRDINILAFWSEEDLEKLEDINLKKMVRKQ
jgi:hypothetical protein